MFPDRTEAGEPESGPDGVLEAVGCVLLTNKLSDKKNTTQKISAKIILVSVNLVVNNTKDIANSLKPVIIDSEVIFCQNFLISINQDSQQY